MAKRRCANKGPNWERFMAHYISQWWSRKGDDDLFWHTHGSGARATVRARAGKRTRGQYGDICATDGRGKKLMQCFTFSLKRGYQTFSIQDMTDTPSTNKNPPQYRTWFKEIIAQARQAKSISWILLHKKNRRNGVAFMPINFVLTLPFQKRKRLMEMDDCIFVRLRTKNPKKVKIRKMGSFKYLQWYLRNNCCIIGIPMDRFFETMDRDDIEAIVKANPVC